MLSELDEYVKIHGDRWKWVDVEDSVEWARQETWVKRKWAAGAALVSKSGVSDYAGQRFNPEYMQLVDDAWTHDHCEICWWSLYESDEDDHGVGYTTDGHKWLCSECFSQFVENKA